YPAVIIKIEETQPGVTLAGIGHLDPACGVPALPDDPFHLQMPVAGEALGVEPVEASPAAYPLPGLLALVHTLLGHQAGEPGPVPGLGGRPVGRHHVAGIV